MNVRRLKSGGKKIRGDNVIGVILCTHSTFADGLKNAVEMIAGKQENFDSICFMNGDDLSDLEVRINQAASKYQAQNMPYCIITDLFAATPFNVAMKHSIESGACVISGASLPLMLEVLISRENFESKDLQAFLEASLNSVKDSMKVINAQAMLMEE